MDSLEVRFDDKELLPVLAAAFEGLQDAALIADARGHIVWANPAYCGLTGWLLDQLVGHPWRLLKPPQEDAASAEIWASLSTTGRWRGRLVDHRNDRSVFHADVSLVRLPALGRGPSYLVATLRDATMDVEMESYLAKLAQQAADARDASLLALAGVAESRDPTVGNHLKRIEAYTRLLAEWAFEKHPDRLPDWARSPRTIGWAAQLHDIGKARLPDALILKTGPLTADEQLSMREHPVLGAQIIDRVLRRQPESPSMRIARDIAAYHHEAFDASGYPYGLAGDSIPLVAQLTTVADVFDSLTSRRPFRPPHRFDDALAWVVARAGKKLGPMAVQALLARRKEVAEVYRSLGDAPGESPPVRASGMDDAAPPAEPLATPLESPPSPSTLGGMLWSAFREAIAKKSTGDIVVRAGDDSGHIYFQSGRIAWAQLGTEKEGLSARLVDAGGVPAEEIKKTIDECRINGRNFAEVLMQRGLITRERLREIVRTHLAQRLAAILDLPDPLALFVPQQRSYSSDLAFGLDELLVSR